MRKSVMTSSNVPIYIYANILKTEKSILIETIIHICCIILICITKSKKKNKILLECGFCFPVFFTQIIT